MLSVCCATYGPPDNLQRIETATPEPQAGEVLVAVRAAGVGFVDGLMIQGLYQVKPSLPYYPGSEFAGEVRALGPGVEQVAVGERVMGLAGSGAYSDYVAVPAAGLIQLNDKLDDATGAGFYINYATALYGLRDCGQLMSGETVLVLGAAGGVGSAAICVAKALGAEVIAAGSTAAKRAAALSFGADAAVDYSRDDWRDELRALLGRRGLDLVYDPVGGSVSEPAFRSLAPGGRHLVVGFASATIPKIALNLALLKRASIVGVDWGGESRANPQINVELMATLFELLEQGRLHCAPVTERPMANIVAALTEQLAGQAVGKIVLVND
jgi:NADPH2:quinone reductase